MMPYFDRHSLEVLEYPKIIAILKGLCLTAYGIDRVQHLTPMIDLESIRIRRDEISQMKDIIQFGENFPLYRLDDVNHLIRNAKTEGIFLEPKELLSVKNLIEISINLHNYSAAEKNKYPLITQYLNQLGSLPEIKRAIDRSIDVDGEILDSASAALKKIRSEISRLKSSISGRLNQLLAGRQKTPGWQDDTVTQRDGRYVIPVVAGQFRPASGIIHGRSHSGATIFIEPNEVIESNNRLGLHLQEERLEIQRILSEITAMIGHAAADLLANGLIIGILDTLHAIAGFALKTSANSPELTDHPKIDLKAARHPLLIYYQKNLDAIIPNDFLLDDSRLGLIITGPNTGGKTVALKTVGLLTLMAQSGMPVPADSASTIGIFHRIFADIGDEQSLELSLSTFSSHIRQIIHAVRHAGPDSLVLLDEIGAGTDPKEGSVLAESIIVRLAALGARTMVTTHYSQLKTLPMLHPELENASFEFDRDSLEPTFRLHTGIPGASYAVEIARRLGMPANIVDNASRLLGTGERSLTDLISSLEKELATLRRDKNDLEEKLQNAASLERQYKSRMEQIEKEIDALKEQHLKELEETLIASRVEIEKIVKEIRESKASEESVKKAHTFIKKKKEKLHHLKSRYPKKRISTEIPIPGDPVWIESLKSEGEYIAAAGPDKARVRIGNIMSIVDISDLKKMTPSSEIPPKSKSSVNVESVSGAGPEIHLRGMTVDEATEALDKFLDSAVISGLKQIYVIHGKGTGTLRRAISDFLKNHPTVQSLRMGDWNEGGAGVTVVHLK